MGFLRKRDYFTEIREKDLDVITKELGQITAQSPDKVREENELNMQDVVSTHIKHRYDVRKGFAPIIPFVLADQYNIGDLIEYSEAAYDATLPYVAPNRVSFKQVVNKVTLDQIFQANAAVAVGESPLTTPGKWDLVTNNFQLYFAEKPSTGNLPDTAFSFTENAFTDRHDTILGWDKTKTIFLKRIDSTIRIYYSAADRTANVDSIGLVDFDPHALVDLNDPSAHNHRHDRHIHNHNQDPSHRTGHQFDPSIKQFPTSIPILSGDDRENSLTGELTISGFMPLDTEWDVVPTNFFIEGDNRNRTIKKILLNLAIFELHKLINPRTIPELRFQAKDDNLALLMKISSGAVEIDLPVYFDEQRGQRVTSGSETKLRHNY